MSNNNSKDAVYTAFLEYGTQAAYQIACERNGGEITPKNGRKIENFSQYVANNEIKADLAEMMTDYLTAEEPHDYEIAQRQIERKRAAKEAEREKLRAIFRKA